MTSGCFHRSRGPKLTIRLGVSPVVSSEAGFSVGSVVELRVESPCLWQLGLRLPWAQQSSRFVIGADVSQEIAAIRQSIRTPRAAAIAGILFTVLLITSQTLIWLSIPSDPSAPAINIVGHSKTIMLALNLLPFAGIAFLWFIAVVRDRLGELEDRFFATVFLGSGLLYVAMIFTAAALAATLIALLAAGPNELMTSGVYPLGRGAVYRFMSVYATKMSAVFMTSGSTIFARTRIVPRWIALVGYVAAVILLLSVGSVKWIVMVFPLWVILISGCILLQNRKAWLEREIS